MQSPVPAYFSSQRQRFIYDRAPKLVYWESTQSCALACVHCRAAAMPYANPYELNTQEGRALIDQVAAFGDNAPHLVITGGDPLRRADLFELIDYGCALGLSVSVTPAGSDALTPAVIHQFKQAGVTSLALSLDGATPATHDIFRGVAGSFDWTLAGARAIVAEGIPLQINTMVTAQTLEDLPHVYEVVKGLGIARWALFFLIATGRGTALAEVTPGQSEQVMTWLSRLNRAADHSFIIATTEAPHYRRVAVQKMQARMSEEQMLAIPSSRSFGIRDGNGIIFVSHLGEVYPSGFLPLEAGNVRRDSLVKIYRSSELFTALRDTEQLTGKCGDCAYRLICGGSRARAYAFSGDPLASDPLCPYQPPVHHRFAVAG